MFRISIRIVNLIGLVFLGLSSIAACSALQASADQTTQNKEARELPDVTPAGFSSLTRRWEGKGTFSCCLEPAERDVFFVFIERSNGNIIGTLGISNGDGRYSTSAVGGAHAGDILTLFTQGNFSGRIERENQINGTLDRGTVLLRIGDTRQVQTVENKASFTLHKVSSER